MLLGSQAAGQETLLLLVIGILKYTSSEHGGSIKVMKTPSFKLRDHKKES